MGRRRRKGEGEACTLPRSWCSDSEHVLGLGWMTGWLQGQPGPFGAASLSFIPVPGGWLCVGAPSTQSSLPAWFWSQEGKAPAPLLKQQPAPLVSSLLPAGTSVQSAASCWLLLLLLGPPADWEESTSVGWWRSGTLKGAALFLLKIYYLAHIFLSFRNQYNLVRKVNQIQSDHNHHLNVNCRCSGFPLRIFKQIKRQSLLAIKFNLKIFYWGHKGWGPWIWAGQSVPFQGLTVKGWRLELL